MQQRSSIGSPRSANSFYFMFFATSIFLKDSKELEMSPDPHPKLKFLIYKGKDGLIIGPQMFNYTREVVKPNLTSGWSKLEKVEMCFFLKEFQSNRKVEFMSLLYDIGSEQEQFLGDIVLSTHKYVEAYREGVEIVHEQGEFGPYVVNYVVLIEKDRHRLEKLFKSYKESKEYLELEEVTEINVGSLAEPANSQKIIESAKGIENNDFRLGVEEGESSPVGKVTEAEEETPNFVEQREEIEINNSREESEQIENRNNNEEIELTVKIEEPEEVEHKSDEIIENIQKTESNSIGHKIEQQNKQNQKELNYSPVINHSSEPSKPEESKETPIPNLLSKTKENIKIKEQSKVPIQGKSINRAEQKSIKTPKSEEKPTSPIKKQLNSEKKIEEEENLESMNSNKSLEFENHDEPAQFKITFRVLIFILLSGILIYHFLNPIEPSLKPKKLRKPKKGSQTVENIPIQNKTGEKVQPKKSK